MTCQCGATREHGCPWPDMPIEDRSPGCVDLTLVSFVPLADFAAVDEPGAEPLVEVAGSTHPLRAAIPAGGLVLAYGDGGSGKTTMLIDLAYHLATGRDWCGILSPLRPLNVAWIENEGPRPMMRAKLRAKNAAWEGQRPGDRISVMNEPWGQFTFRKPRLRDALVSELNRLEADILIVGPLSRLGMEGGGTTDDIRQFLDLVQDVQRACEITPTIAAIHHENRAGQISGAWEREPDSLIHVQGQGHGRTRVHWQKMRWASELHGITTQLVWAEGEGFTVEEKPEVTEDTIAVDILAAVRDNPGASWSKIRESVTGNATESARVRDRLIGTQLVNTATRDGYFNLHLVDDPTLTRSDLGTALERLPFPIPAGAAEPSRSPVPDVSRNGERNGTAEPGSDDARTAYLEELSLVANHDAEERA